MTAPAPPPAPHLAEAKPLTFADHVVNIFRLVIKELHSIRADPTMLVLVVYAFSISVNTVATGAVSRHRRRGRLGPVAADRRGAEAPDLPAARAHHGLAN